MMSKLKGGHGLFETNHDNRYDRVAPVPLPRLLQLKHCALLRVFHDHFLTLVRSFAEDVCWLINVNLVNFSFLKVVHCQTDFHRIFVKLYFIDIIYIYSIIEILD